MKQLWMLKVMTRGYDAPAWFFISAETEKEARSLVEDSETMVLEALPQEEAAKRLAEEFGHVALVANI